MTDSAAALPDPPHLATSDVALAIGVFLVIAVAISADSSGGSRPIDGYAYLFAAGFGAVLLVRRRYPVGVLLVTFAGICAYYIAHYPPIGLALPLGAALYVAANAGRMRWAVGTAGVLVSLALFFRIARGEELRYLLLYDTPLTVAVMAVSIALGDSQRSRAMWRQELDRTTRQALWQREQQMRERVADERARIARDLHDSIGHGLAVISLHADVALECDAALPPDTSEALARIRQASRDAMGELRGVVAVLRTPEPGVASPTLADLEELTRHVSAGRFSVQLHAEGGLSTVPAAVGTTAYRIVQEALTNTARHAACQHARVDIRVGATCVEVTVADDGVGDHGTAAVPAGHGIRGMAERAAALGGKLDTGPGDAGGFVVHAVLPTGAR